MTNSPKGATYKEATSSLLTKPQEGVASLPSANRNSQIASSESAINNSANLPNYFHFIADSTFPNLQTAVEQIKTLQVAVIVSQECFGYQIIQISQINVHLSFIQPHLAIALVASIF